MIGKKINQLATELAPATTDLTIIGNPVTGVSKKITLSQIANLFATSGTVTSVAVTETGNALTITGSPITTAGTINIGFAGAATQYVRGDGQLSDFPTSTGGGSSVSYYLNSSVSQGTLGGVAYRQFSKTPIAGAGTDISVSANGYIASYITDANDPALLEVPAGNFNCEFYFSVNSNNHNPYVYAEVYKYDGTTFTLLGSSQSVPEYLTFGTTLSPYYFAVPVTATVLTITDRIAIRIYANVDGRTVTLHTENSHLCQVVTTFSKGLTSLNNLTRQVQFLATGTSGTDFNIASSTATHTFNLPTASATNRGALSSADWTTFNNKQNALTNPVTGTGTANYIPKWSATTGEIINGSLVDIGGSIYNALTNPGQFSWQFNGDTGTGQSFGALINAGTNASDIALRIQNASSTSVYFYVWGDGKVQINNIPNATTDTDRFLVSDSGVIKYRTGAELLSDIGGQPSGSYVTSVNSLTGAVTLTTTNIAEGTNLYYTEARVNANTNVAANTAARHNAVTIGTANGLSLSTQVLSLALASGSTTGALSSTDWTTFNNKQSALNGTGFVKISGTTISYDNSTYLTTSAASSTYLPLAGGTLTGALGGTSASFSSYIETGGGLKATGNTLSSGIGAEVLYAGGNGYFQSFNRTTSAYLPTILDGLTLSIQTGGTPRLTIASTGAATFSSSVTAANSVTSSGSQGRFGGWYDGLGFIGASAEIGVSGGIAYVIGYNRSTSSAIPIVFGNAGNTTSMTGSSLSFTGAATFSSSVTATSFNGTTNNIFSVSGTEGMRLTSTGLGIGTTSPTSKLHVEDATVSADNKILVLQSSHASQLTKGTLGFTSSVFSIQASNIAGSANQNISLNPSGGSVGIGTTSPAYPLQVRRAGGGGSLGISIDGVGSTDRTVQYFAIQDSASGVGSGHAFYYRAPSSTTDTLGFILDESGNVGIGTTSPNAPLEVYGQTRVSASGGSVFLVTPNATSTNGIVLESSYYGSAGYGPMNFHTGGNERMRITSGGEVYIAGTTDQGAYNLQVNGTGVWGAGAYVNGSDFRLKENISDLDNSLELINKMKPVTYNYKGSYSKDSSTQTGFIAQDLKELLKDKKYLDGIVKQGPEYMSVAYQNLIPLLVKGIQELKQELETLKNK